MKIDTIKAKLKRKWTLKREIKAQTSNLETLGSEHHSYKPTLEAIEKCSEIRNKKNESRAKILKDIGTLALFGFVALTAYKIDKDEDIPRNKNSMSLFKMFKL